MSRAIKKLRECLKESGVPQLTISKELGENPQIINRQLCVNKDLKCERFLQIMDIIGYEVTVSKKED